MGESLSETRRWRQEQEQNITYFDNISNMTLPNDGKLPDYNELADKLNDNFSKFINKIDEAVSEK